MRRSIRTTSRIIIKVRRMSVVRSALELRQRFRCKKHITYGVRHMASTIPSCNRIRASAI
ncbi:hypothetical protein SERLA73DRAFT_178699 [Serpula lacrymans var. lacrymans S7.3]|uniref:Uncharacterized protein n=1 Tax=Serpula lacrymans var. lacrymans (strain S7.3) TaxID=936435 RepID=F8PSL1_SERL3|nr:hypothetical protein SERLA73DRAFT_178699 [Serpula lacrymans var. lacrymans S7.3]